MASFRIAFAHGARHRRHLRQHARRAHRQGSPRDRRHTVLAQGRAPRPDRLALQHRRGLDQIAGRRGARDARPRDPRHRLIRPAERRGRLKPCEHACSARYPLTSLYRPPRMREMDALVRRGRERLGARLVPVDAGGVRALYQTLARGEVIGMLPDQEPGAGNGLFAPLFGIEANAMALLPRLAIKAGAPVIFCYAERLSWGRGYHLHFIPAPSAIQAAPIEHAVRVMNEGVEALVRRCPQQYQWGYKRFRTRPAGEKPLY